MPTHKIQFINTSTGNPTSYLWDFGDGTSTATDPQHTFIGWGNDFNTTLSAFKADETSILSRTNNFIARFTWKTNDKIIAFFDGSDEPVYAWDWDFGDGTPHSTERNPQHTYANYGSYTVTLIINNGAANIYQTVDVAAIDFTWDATYSTNMVQFTGTITDGTPLSWKYSYLDQKYSNYVEGYMTDSVQSPLHRFPLLNYATHSGEWGQSFLSVAYGNGVYVAGGFSYYGRCAARSTDGTTWSNIQVESPSTFCMFNTVIFDGTRFVAAGMRKIYTSTDGSSWTISYNSGADTTVYNFMGLIYTGSKYLLCGNYMVTVDPWSYAPRIWSSTNLTSITVSYTGEVTGDMWYYAQSIATNGTNYICNFTRSWDPVNYVVRSFDTTTWSYVPLPESIQFHNNQGENSTPGQSVVTFAKDRYFLCGTNAILSSPDGTTWTKCNRNSQTFNCVNWVGDKFIVACSGPNYQYSLDGTAWVQPLLNSAEIASGHQYVYVFYDASRDLGIMTNMNSNNYNNLNPLLSYITQSIKTVKLDVQSPSSLYSITKYVPVGDYATDFLWQNNSTDAYSKDALRFGVDDITAVPFEDISNTTPSSHEWRVDNTVVSTTQNPTIDLSLYPNIVISDSQVAWSVKQKVTFGSVTKTKINQVSYYTAPTASFTSTSSENIVRFTSTASGGVTSYYWDFGDGTNSTDQNPIHAYFDYGATYLVTLTARNTVGESVFSQDATTEPPRPGRVDFTRPDYSPDTTDEITPLVHLKRNNSEYFMYNAISESTYTSYSSPADTEWSGYFSEPQPNFLTLSYNNWESAVSWPGYMLYNIVYLHLITENRYFEVRLTNWNYDTGAGLSYHRYELGPAAYFTFVKDTTETRGVYFTDRSFPNPSSWHWYFGDGAEDTVQNPTHIYPDHTTAYDATLIVMTTMGDATKVTKVTTGGGAGVSFSRPDGHPEIIDSVTASVQIARANTKGIYNPLMEPGFQGAYYNSPSPEGTEWANQLFTDPVSDPRSLTYGQWVGSHGGYPPSQVGMISYMHVIAEDQYFEIHWSAWTSSGGGGFAYTRYEV